MVTKYRSDIDGLRGLAVVLVLLFHVKAPFSAGGFVGVDIFIVISGYLITSLIMERLETGTFSLLEFYIRRVRRLFPALLATIAVSFAAACFILPPHLLARMAGSAIYALSSMSNIYFWQERGYFDTEAATKPLLHTWSLSVEEQFYLFWPFLLVGLWRVVSLRRFMPLILAAIIAASAWASAAMLKLDGSAAFFLTPFRVFEFALGGSLYWLRGQALREPRLRAVVYGAGLGLVLLSLSLFHYSDQFPGWRALVPCLGAMLLIHAGERNPVARLLDNRVMVGLGTISYSLYLVHWPVISLYRSTTFAELSVRAQIGVLAVSLVLAVLLYVTVERPFRHGRGAPAAGEAGLRFGLASCLAALAAVLPLAQAWASGGWSWRYPAALRPIAELREKELVAYTWSNWLDFLKPAFEEGRTKVLIVGDSQAADTLNLMVEARLDEKYSIRVINIDYACSAVFIPPERDKVFYGEENPVTKIDPVHAEACRAQKKAAFESPLVGAADVILWAPLWFPWNEPYLPATLARLKATSKARIVVVGSKIWSFGSIEIALRKRSLAGLPEYGATFVQDSVLQMNARLKVVAERDGAIYFDLMRFLCPTRERCDVLTPGLRPSLHNAGHYSMWGAAMVSRRATAPLVGVIERGAE